MGFFCAACNRTWPTRTGFFTHISTAHWNPRPPPPSEFCYHETFTAKPCNKEGVYLPEDLPPPPRDELPPTDWTPFANRPSFEFAELNFEKLPTSADDINQLLRNWAGRNVLEGHNTTMYENVDNILETIDSIPHRDAQ